MNYVIAAKVLTQAVLLVVFLNYFGLESWKTYQEESIVTTSKENLVDFVNAPAITICPRSPFEEIKTKEDNVMEFICNNTEGPDIAECFGGKVPKVEDIVISAYKGDHRGEGKHFGTGIDFWGFSFYKREACYTLTNPDHFGSHPGTDRIWIKLNSNRSSDYDVFIHDPTFFVYSKNPKLNINYGSLAQKVKRLDKIEVVKHTKLNTENKPCNTDASYSFTTCVREVLVKENGCKPYWFNSSSNIHAEFHKSIDLHFLSRSFNLKFDTSLIVLIFSIFNIIKFN